MNANLLRGKIAEAGMTQRDLAEKLSVSVNTMTAKMNGRSCFSLNEAVRICDVLNITDDADKIRIFFA